MIKSQVKGQAFRKRIKDKDKFCFLQVKILFLGVIIHLN